jgi:hypothetical protein
MIRQRLMQFVYFWLAGKKHISEGQVCPKTNLTVSAAELTYCLVYEYKIRILTFVYLLIC